MRQIKSTLFLKKFFESDYFFQKMVRNFTPWGSHCERIGSRLEETPLYSRFFVGFNLKYSFSNAG